MSQSWNAPVPLFSGRHISPQEAARDLGLRVQVVSIDGLRYAVTGKLVLVGFTDSELELRRRTACGVALYLLTRNGGEPTTGDVASAALAMLAPTDLGWASLLAPESVAFAG